MTIKVAIWKVKNRPWEADDTGEAKKVTSMSIIYYLSPPAMRSIYTWNGIMIIIYEMPEAVVTEGSNIQTENEKDCDYEVIQAKIWA